jgi:chemotaxis protein histidine kinase CheA
MSEAPQGELIPASSLLHAKIGGSFPGIDAAAIAKAEAALAELSGNFAQWLQEELDRLDVARKAVTEQAATPEAVDRLYMCAHDLKGLGTTYEFPLITRIAASLCRLLEEPARRAAAPMVMVDAHIQAIKAAVRDNIREDSHPVGRILAEELERGVKTFLSDR